MTKARQLADLISSGSIETGEITSLDAAKLTGSIADARVPASAVTQHANNYVHPNHSGAVTSTADGATVIVDNIVDEANLKVSNSPTNGYFLQAQSGNTGGLTWSAVTPAAITATANGSNNRIATYSDTSELNGEANLVFDGTNLGVGETSPLGKVHIKNGDTGGSVNAVGDELVIEKSGGSGGMSILTDNDQTGYILWGDSDATAQGQLYFDHSAGRFAILGGSDIKFGQHVLPNANNSYDLGSTSLVWRNIYTSDLNMSNEYLDKGNEVDGTKGSWSIQEGEEDLFLLNRKNGKKYKFKMEEIK